MIRCQTSMVYCNNNAGIVEDVINEADLVNRLSHKFTDSSKVAHIEMPHDLMKRSLEPAGYRVMSAFDGRYGLELARQFQPGAITLDISMPGMDGWSVLAELKGNPITSAIPVIMTSVIEDRGLAFALGASEYLTKPLDRGRLLLKIPAPWKALAGVSLLG